MSAQPTTDALRQLRDTIVNLASVWENVELHLGSLLKAVEMDLDHWASRGARDQRLLQQRVDARSTQSESPGRQSFVSCSRPLVVLR